jgi:hypothetical protein
MGYVFPEVFIIDSVRPDLGIEGRVWDASTQSYRAVSSDTPTWSDESDSSLCPDCITTALNDLRVASLEQNKVLEYLLVATARKNSARDVQKHLRSIDLVNDLLTGGGDEDLCGHSSEVD